MDKGFWQEKLNNVPLHPGVYLFKDENGSIIYVGKAKLLKNRLSSYFRDASSLAPKTLAMRERARDLEYILVDSAAEALLLECNLIKLYRPKYNILLKDDKTYPYLKVTLQEEYPRLLKTRRYVNDGAKYYGPFTDGKAMYETLDVLRRCFPLRSCGAKPGKIRGRACLNYDIGKCPGPCMNYISQRDYAKTVEGVIGFLNGNGDEVINLLKQKMEEASDNLAFEQAAEYRDKLEAINVILDRQKISLAGSSENRDFIAVTAEGNEAVVAVFSVREGRLIRREHRFVESCDDSDVSGILSVFIPEFYSGDRLIPLHIFVEELPEDSDALLEILSQRRGGPVHFDVPKRGEKIRMLQLAAKNGEMLLAEAKRDKNRDDTEVAAALENLRLALNLSYTPKRIECYDISHFQGSYTVGSMIVFINGKPQKSQYRRFKIKTVKGIDDFASLNEVLDRRYAHGIEDIKQGKATSFSDFPDLFIIDGGKGQLSATLKIKQKYDSDIPFVSLAKREEELIIPGREDSLILPKGSPEFHLIQRIRDEAHRFAITFHRELRGKGQVRSELEDIPGIGPARRRSLLKHFKNIKNIASASIEEIKLVEGMTESSAEAVHDYFLLKQKDKK